MANILLQNVIHSTEVRILSRKSDLRASGFFLRKLPQNSRLPEIISKRTKSIKLIGVQSNHDVEYFGGPASLSNSNFELGTFLARMGTKSGTPNILQLCSPYMTMPK